MHKTPSQPYFSSGPCRKYHSHDPSSYPDALLHRSRQAQDCRDLIASTINQTKEALKLPDGYQVIITQGSDTGAIEAAFWNLLTHNGTTILSWSNFGNKWRSDLEDQLKLRNLTVHELDHQTMTYSDLLEINNKIPQDDDLVLIWNATTVGLCLPDLNWLSPNHQGLVMVDGTSIVFAQDLPWERLDVVSFSWQKVLGGEAGLGMLVLSPNAINRLKNYQPEWPIPVILNLRNQKGEFNHILGKDNTTNTISFLLVDDYLKALKWWKGEYQNSSHAHQKLKEKLQWIDQWLEKHHDLGLKYLIGNPSLRSPTAVTLKTSLSSEELKVLHTEFEKNLIALDIKSHPYAQEGIRIWIGPTIEFEDLKILFQHLERYLSFLGKKIES